MAKFPERLTTPRTFLDFRFCLELLFVFDVIGSFEKKIDILCSQVTFCLVNSFSSSLVRVLVVAL